MELMLTKVGVDSIINGVLVIPIGVTRISTDAINEECAKLIKVVYMTDTMQKIDDYAFFKCLNLEKVFVGKKSALQYIGTRAFARTAISDFYLPDGVTVCSGAFRDTNIKKIEVPQKCTYYNISGTKDSPLNSFGKGVKITKRAIEEENTQTENNQPASAEIEKNLRQRNPREKNPIYSTKRESQKVIPQEDTKVDDIVKSTTKHAIKTKTGQVF